MSKGLERRLGSPALGYRWDCLAVDADELAPRPPRETWLGVSAADGNVAAIAWAAPLRPLGRTLVRAHVIAKANFGGRAHDVVADDVDWSELLADYVATIGRNSLIQGLVATPELTPLLRKASALPDVELMNESVLPYFDSRGIADGYLAHDGDAIVAEQAAWAEIVSWPASGYGIRKLKPEGAISALVASALAFWAAR